VVSRYEVAVRLGRQELRTTLLDAASRLLTEEGSAALTLRQVASDVGCSTTVLYTMFGGKDGLSEALYREGFDRFRRRLQSLPPAADRVTRLYDIAWAYRESALAEPNYYRVMFAHAIPHFTPSADAIAAARASFDVLLDAVRECVESGTFTPGDPREIAEVLWAASHGILSLELGGHFHSGDAENRYRTAITAATSWFLNT
jgi:AcrR family transcriptional regulator